MSRKPSAGTCILEVDLDNPRQRKRVEKLFSSPTLPSIKLTKNRELTQEDFEYAPDLIFSPNDLFYFLMMSEHERHIFMNQLVQLVFCEKFRTDDQWFNRTLCYLFFKAWKTGEALPGEIVMFSILYRSNLMEIEPDWGLYDAKKQRELMSYYLDELDPITAAAEITETAQRWIKKYGTFEECAKS